MELGAELLEHLGGHAFAFADQTEEDVLGPDVVVAELERLAQRQLEDLLRARRERDVAAGGLRALTDDLDDLLAHRFEADAEALETAGGDTFALVDQTEEDVLGSDVVVVEEPRFFLREHHHSPGPVGEPFKHSYSPRKRCGALWFGRPAEYSSGTGISRETGAPLRQTVWMLSADVRHL